MGYSVSYINETVSLHTTLYGDLKFYKFQLCATENQTSIVNYTNFTCF